MRFIALLGLATAALAAPASAACFDQCLSGKIETSSDDLEIRDAARSCRDVCDAEALAELKKNGLSEGLASCRAKKLSLEDFRKVRAASPSYRIQANVFLWDVTNPFPDRLLTRVEVSTQNLDLQEVGFTGTGLVPPSSTATFVIPSFYEGYPAVRFSAKVSGIWACEVK
jgi:hypothetical protein